MQFVNLRQKGFSLIELLIVVAIILIIAAIAIPNFMRTRMNANESAGAATVRTLVSSSITYSINYTQSGFPTTISNLGGASPCVASAATACLVDNALACAAQPCIRDSYQYSLTGIGSGGGGGNADFVAFATPVAAMPEPGTFAPQPTEWCAGRHRRPHQHPLSLRSLPARYYQLSKGAVRS